MGRRERDTLAHATAIARPRSARTDPPARSGAPGAGRLRTARAAGVARVAGARRAQRPPLVAATAPRCVADPGHAPGRGHGDRRDADADGRGPRHGTDRRAGPGATPRVRSRARAGGTP